MTNQAMSNGDKVITTDGQAGILIITGVQSDKASKGLDVEVLVRLADGIAHIFSYKDLEFVSASKQAAEEDIRVFVEYSHDDMVEMVGRR